MRFATDENFDGRILEGLKMRLPELDIVRVQDTEMFQSSDPDLLDWLGKEKRILLTHDARTMPGFVYERVSSGLPTPGVIEVKRTMPLGQAIDELEIVIGAGESEDFKDQVRYLPIR